MAIEFLQPFWLLALLPATAALLWWYRGERRLEGARKTGVAVLRSLMFLLLILAIAGTAFRAPVQQQQTVFVVDESKSIDSIKQAAAWIEAAVGKKQAADGFAVLGVGEKPAVEYPLTLDNQAVIELSAVKNPNYTNLAGGLRLAEGLFEPAYRQRVVLLSDGEQNIGDAIQEAGYLKDRGIRVDVAPLQRQLGSEVLIQSASAPTTLYQGEKFALGITLAGTVATQAEVRVYEDNRQVATTRVDVQKGESRYSIPLQAETPGFHRYRVEIQPALDTESVNNTAYAYGEVAGRPSVLIIEGQPGEAKWLTQALSSGQMPFEVKQASQAPSELDDYRRYAAVVLANVSGTDLPETIQQKIEIAVRDFGIGLMMTGGSDSFGLGGYFNSPIERTLPVYMDIRNKKEIPSLGLMLVIDRSGSMGVEKMEIAKEAARRSAAMLSPQDTLGVVAFDSMPWWVVEPTAAEDVPSLQERISGIQAAGGTEIFPALAEAFTRLETVQAKRKHMILLTDGQSPQGDYDALTSRLNELGITLTTVAVGTDADQSLLRRLAEQGKGRFYATTDSQNVPQIFAKETAMAGKTYIQDQPFIPAVGTARELMPLFAKGLPQINAQIAVTSKETADTVLVNPSGEPLLARWQYGLGRVVAWTSDAKGVWSGQWAAWDGASPFWNQLLTWMLPQYRSDQLDLRTAVSAGQGQLSVKWKQPPAAGSTLKAEVIGTDLAKQEVPLLLTSPGEYAGQFATDRPGTYMVKVTEERDGQVINSSSTGLSVPYSPEYMLPGNGEDVLARIAQAGGGEVLSDPGDVYRDNLASQWQRQDLSLWLLLLAALLWPFDVALRRVRIPFARLFAWLKPRRSRVELAAASSNRVASSVQSLKSKAQSRSQRPAFTPPPEAPQNGRQTSSAQGRQAVQQQAEAASSESTISKLLEKKRKK